MPAALAALLVHTALGNYLRVVRPLGTKPKTAGREVVMTKELRARIFLAFVAAIERFNAIGETKSIIGYMLTREEELPSSRVKHLTTVVGS